MNLNYKLENYEDLRRLNPVKLPERIKNVEIDWFYTAGLLLEKQVHELEIDLNLEGKIERVQAADHHKREKDVAQAAASNLTR